MELPTGLVTKKSDAPINTVNHKPFKVAHLTVSPKDYDRFKTHFKTAVIRPMGFDWHGSNSTGYWFLGDEVYIIVEPKVSDDMPERVVTVMSRDVAVFHQICLDIVMTLDADDTELVV